MGDVDLLRDVDFSVERKLACLRVAQMPTPPPPAPDGTGETLGLTRMAAAIFSWCTAPRTEASVRKGSSLCVRWCFQVVSLCVFCLFVRLSVCLSVSLFACLSVLLSYSFFGTVYQYHINIIYQMARKRTADETSS